MSESYVDFPVFGEDSTKEKPGDQKYNLGFLPGDVLPAEWLNWFLNVMSAGYNQLKSSAENFTPASPNTLTNKTISFADNTLPGVQPTLIAGTGIDITGTTISAKLNVVVDGTEVKTGETYGDKPVYVKAVSFTFSNNGSEASKYHGISNISKIIKIDGWAYSTLGRYHSLNDPFNYMVISTTTMFYAPNNYAGLNGRSGVCYIYCTKTTD